MKKLIGVVAMGGILCCATAFAADPNPPQVPMERALESLNKNIAKNPDASGLQNAKERLLDNRKRQATRGKNHAPGQQKREPSSAELKKTSGDAERTQVVDHVERVDRVERVERIDRPEPPARLEHPAHPGHP